MHRGLEVGIHLSPGIQNENFVAEVLGNLVAYRLQKERHEPLVWQVIRVEEGGKHHFRLVLRHPDRVLDIGLTQALRRSLEDLSREDVAELGQRFEVAKVEGLMPVPLRHLREEPDLWQDDFWNWIG